MNSAVLSADAVQQVKTPEISVKLEYKSITYYQFICQALGDNSCFPLRRMAESFGKRLKISGAPVCMGIKITDNCFVFI